MSIFFLSQSEALEILENFKINRGNFKETGLIIKNRYVLSSNECVPSARKLCKLRTSDTLRIVVDPNSDCGRSVIMSFEILKKIIFSVVAVGECPKIVRYLFNLTKSKKGK